jgi:monovalent cation/hydrogen antiporter
MAASPLANCRPTRYAAARSAPRRSLLTLRQSEDIGDDAFHRLEEEFDWAELSAQG